VRVPGIEYTHAIPVCVCLTEVRRYLYYRADACDKPKASTPSSNCVEQWALRSIADEDLRKDVIERSCESSTVPAAAVKTSRPEPRAALPTSKVAPTLWCLRRASASVPVRKGGFTPNPVRVYIWNAAVTCCHNQQFRDPVRRALVVMTREDRHGAHQEHGGAQRLVRQGGLDGSAPRPVRCCPRRPRPCPGPGYGRRNVGHAQECRALRWPSSRSW
jgi:hypothetical protein